MSTRTITPSARMREELRKRGGDAAVRCYQCGTCSSACELANGNLAFPRRQMLLAQWGLVDQLVTDPAVWLCHQCNDCSVRCPRDAKPGDVMQTARALVVEQLAVPRVVGHLVARAGSTWPILLGLPTLFWIVLLALTAGLNPADMEIGAAFAYEDYVPHSLIYAVFFPVTGLVMFAFLLSGLRFWKSLDGAASRRGSFLSHMIPALTEIATHKRFGSCGQARARKSGHFALLWGFVGAAITSALLIVAIYVMHAAMPLGFWHPFKILGNVSAVLLVVGGFMLLFNRVGKAGESGASTAFDMFFLNIVVLVIVTGVAVEVLRLAAMVDAGCYLYILHLGAVMCLFLTCPYSKFAHLVYRTLAMIHERMIGTARS